MKSWMDDYLTPDREHDYRKSVPQRGGSGGVLLDGKHVADTLRCVHCSAHWIPVKGSGKRRGYCTACKGVVCGSPECDVCIPLDKKLEGIETGKSVPQILKDLEKVKHIR